MPGVGRGHEHHDFAGGDLRLPIALLTCRPVIRNDPLAARHARHAEHRTGDRQRGARLGRDIACQNRASAHVADVADELIATWVMEWGVAWSRRRPNKMGVSGHRDATHVIRGGRRVGYKRQRIVGVLVGDVGILAVIETLVLSPGLVEVV